MTDDAKLPASLALVGAGKMAQPSDSIRDLSARRGIALNPARARPVEALVLAIKPQSLDEAAPALGSWIGPSTLLVSILAGKTIADLRQRLPQARAVVRAMPNLPASVGHGATGAAASPETSEAQRAVAHALLSSVGIVEWLDCEALIDAVTALSGSGPAYVFHLVECLAQAGVAAGLPADLSMRLARATVSGAGELLRRSDAAPAALRESVTSRGGTTAAALEVLMGEDRLARLMQEAVAAAKRRAGELSG
jgi:pyrroline-5-carboxylate reductase